MKIWGSAATSYWGAAGIPIILYAIEDKDIKLDRCVAKWQENLKM